MAKEKIADVISPEMKTKMMEGTKPETEKSVKPKRYAKANGIKEALTIYPKHIVKLVNICRSNSDIGRYCSLAILNNLYTRGITNTPKGYVSFNWTKFKVVTSGLSTEYRYTEDFFLNSLIASFTAFANAAQNIIGKFCEGERKEFTPDDNEIKTAVEVAEKADAVAEDKENQEIQEN